MELEKQDTIGHLLQKSREKKKISIDEISQRTKITINMLRFLESNQLEKLPQKAFVRGFVQNYCKTLGVDVEPALEALDRTYLAQQMPNGKYILPVRAPQRAAKDAVAAEESGQEMSIEQMEVREKLVNTVRSFFNKKVIFSVLAVVIVVGTAKTLVSFLYQISDEQKQASRNSEEVKAQTVVEPSLKSAEENLFDIKASKKLLNETTPIATPTPVVVEAPKVEPKKEVEVPAGKYPYIEFTSAPTNHYSLLSDAAEVSDEALLPPNIKAAMNSDKANVFVNAHKGSTWISYKVDDEKVKRYVLEQGRTLFLQGNTVLMFLGNVNATTIFYNNNLVGINSRTGVKSLIFPQEKASAYYLPLFPTYNGAPIEAEVYRANMLPKQSE